jgi:hypothetical protein
VRDRAGLEVRTRLFASLLRATCVSVGGASPSVGEALAQVARETFLPAVPALLSEAAPVPQHALRSLEALCAADAASGGAVAAALRSARAGAGAADGPRLLPVVFAGLATRPLSRSLLAAARAVVAVVPEASVDAAFTGPLAEALRGTVGPSLAAADGGSNAPPARPSRHENDRSELVLVLLQESLDAASCRLRAARRAGDVSAAQAARAALARLCGPRTVEGVLTRAFAPSLPARTAHGRPEASPRYASTAEELRVLGSLCLVRLDELAGPGRFAAGLLEAAQRPRSAASASRLLAAALGAPEPEVRTGLLRLLAGAARAARPADRPRLLSLAGLRSCVRRLASVARPAAERRTGPGRAAPGDAGSDEDAADEDAADEDAALAETVLALCAAQAPDPRGTSGGGGER